jgi:hypothetical protein
MPVKRNKAIVVLLLCATLAAGWASPSIGGALQGAAVMPFEGYVRAIKIDLCGLQPGRCEGSMVLANSGCAEMLLAIKPGMRIRRGEHVLTIDELGAGDYVRVQAMQEAGEILPHILTVEIVSP